MLVTAKGLILANGAALALAAAWLASLVVPYDRAVRVRNAFLLRRGSESDVDWTPDAVPRDFRVEHLPAPREIAAAVEREGVRDIEGDWPRALALVTMLVRHAKQEGHARADLVTTYREIVAGGGSCADYVRVYLAAAHDVGLFCRQWGFSFDGFGGHGHTFVEVFDRDRSQWSFIDVHNNVVALEEGSEVPLGAIAVRALLSARPSALRFVAAGPGRLAWAQPSKLLAYYQRGADEWYLLWGNDVVSRDGRLGRWSHRLQSALARLPPFLALVTARNEAAFARMLALRSRVRRAVATIAILVVALSAQLALPPR